MKTTCLLGAAALLAAMPLPAQDLSLRVGGLRARYAGAVNGNALAIAPRAEWNELGMRGVLEASFAEFGRDGWASQTALELASSRPLGRGSLATMGAASLNYLESGVWSANWQASAAYGGTLGPVYGSAGLAAGALRRVAGSLDGQLAAFGAVSRYVAGARVSGRLQRAKVAHDVVDDASVSAEYSVGRVSLAAIGGLRRFRDTTDGLWQAQLVAPLHRLLALEAAVGAWPRSPEGFTQGRFVSVGLRLRAPPRPPSTHIERLSPSRVRVTIRMRGVRTVGIAGDWNQWSQTAMRDLGGGQWTVELPLGPGAHKFALLLDGERWTVPDGVPTLPDDFGGRVGLIVIG